MSELSDAELVAAARDGDPQAFDLLIARYDDEVLALLLRRLRSRPLAEDVAQEVRLEAWLSLGKLLNPAAFRFWLRKIAKHQAADAERRRGNDRRRAATLFEAGRFTEGHGGQTPYEALQRRVTRERIVREIRALPETYAGVLIMQFDELSSDEIAERLQISRNTVHKRLSRGRELLSERLDKDALALGALAAAGLLERSPEWLAPSMMRAVRNKLRWTARALQLVVVGILGAAGRLPRSVVSGTTGVMAALLVPVNVLFFSTLVALPGLLEMLDPSAEDPSPPRSGSSAVSIRPPVALQPQGQAPATVDELDQAAVANDVEPYDPEPDYVVRSESTRVGTALFGDHGLQPMDDYGKQLYEWVSKAFAMHLALCLRSDVVGPEDASRIGVKLEFWLGPSSRPEPHVFRDRAEKQVVTALLRGLELSKMQKWEAERCLEDAFHKTSYPPPPDGKPRLIHHHIEIDFAAIQMTILSVVTPLIAHLRR